MKMKRKGIILASAILGSVAVVSTGFAAWVISTPKDTVAGGNIQVETISQDATSIAYTFADGNDVLHFGAPEQVIEDAWLKNDAMGKEDLDASFNVKVTRKTGTDTTSTNATGKVTVTLQLGINEENDDGKMEFVDQTSTILAACDGLIKLPADFDNETHSKEYTLVDGAATIAAEFGWGTTLGGETFLNPYVYFNNQEYSDTLGTTAYTNLDKLNTALKDKVFNFKIVYSESAN